MRLSEAILLGSMLGPQSFGLFVDSEATCAMGAAAAALGIGHYAPVIGPLSPPFEDGRNYQRWCKWCGFRQSCTLEQLFSRRRKP